MTEHSLGNVSADQLRSYVERVEAIEREIADRNADKRDVYAEAKGNGFDAKAIKKIVSERREDASALREFETILDLYRDALRMA